VCMCDIQAYLHLRHLTIVPVIDVLLGVVIEQTLMKENCS
jgi:hypothetical protein